MIRTILTTSENILTVPLPEKYVGKKVEVIIFSIDESQESAINEKQNVSFNAIKLDTKSFKFNRDEANER